jgi:hypothetical protein
VKPIIFVQGNRILVVHGLYMYFGVYKINIHVSKYRNLSSGSVLSLVRPPDFIVRRLRVDETM